jgi:hypothetical protein
VGVLDLFRQGFVTIADVLLGVGFEESSSSPLANDQRKATIVGLINLIHSAQELLKSNHIPEDEYAMLLGATFSRHSTMELVFDLFRSCMYHSLVMEGKEKAKIGKSIILHCKGRTSDMAPEGVISVSTADKSPAAETESDDSIPTDYISAAVFVTAANADIAPEEDMVSDVKAGCYVTNTLMPHHKGEDGMLGLPSWHRSWLKASQLRVCIFLFTSYSIMLPVLANQQLDSDFGGKNYSHDNTANDWLWSIGVFVYILLLCLGIVAQAAREASKTKNKAWRTTSGELNLVQKIAFVFAISLIRANASRPSDKNATVSANNEQWKVRRHH